MKRAPRWTPTASPTRLILLVVMALVPVAAAERFQATTMPPLKNADVIKLVRSGVSDAITITSIGRADQTDFDLSPDGIVGLKQAKVGDAVIAAMFERSEGRPAPAAAVAPPTPTPAAAASSPHLPVEVGIYLTAGGQFRDVNPEIVHWRIGGFWRGVMTAGIAGRHINGSVPQPHSTLQISSPAELIVVTPEGFAITEYQLLRLDVKDDRREFRMMSASIAGARSGPDGHLVRFEAEKVAPRTYRVRIDVPNGEYGLLPPGATGANMTAIGKIYGFSVK
jgi:hypothetical protein